MSDEPLIPAETWDAARLPEGFTAADGVAIMAIESGLTLQPWQFDFLARFFDEPRNAETPRHSGE